MHVMAGVIPECKDDEKSDMLRKMEETFVCNLKYAAERLGKVMHNWIHA